jgi:hypothetical protein
LVGAKIPLAPETDLATVAATIDAAEPRIRAAVPAARVIWLEPDLDQAMTGWAARRLLGVSGVSANSVTYRGRGGGSCRRWRNQAL